MTPDQDRDPARETQRRAERFLTATASADIELPFAGGLLPLLFRRTSESSYASLDEIGAIVSRDQGLSARVLALANSSYYGLQSRVGTISRAVVVLGMAELRMIVLTLAMKSLAGRLPRGRFDFKAELKHQLAVARTAALLAMHDPDCDPETLFACGLLHDVGKLVMLLVAPKDYQTVQELAVRETLPSALAEERIMGLEHGMVGAMLLKAWNLPQELVEPVNWHHDPALAPWQARAASLLAVSDAAVHLEGATAKTGATGAPLVPHWQGVLDTADFDPLDVCRAASEALADTSLFAFADSVEAAA